MLHTRCMMTTAGFMSRYIRFSTTVCIAILSRAASTGDTLTTVSSAGLFVAVVYVELGCLRCVFQELLVGARAPRALQRQSGGFGPGPVGSGPRLGASRVCFRSAAAVASGFDWAGVGGLKRTGRYSNTNHRPALCFKVGPPACVMS